MSSAAGSVNGMGGGHDIAAGATIPKEAKSEFIRMLDTIIGTQLRTT